LGYWDIGILGYWDIGILGYWDIRILGYWDIGIRQTDGGFKPCPLPTSFKWV
jgi:hypothetical protein